MSAGTWLRLLKSSQARTRWTPNLWLARGDVPLLVRSVTQLFMLGFMLYPWNQRPEQEWCKAEKGHKCEVWRSIKAQLWPQAKKERRTVIRWLFGTRTFLNLESFWFYRGRIFFGIRKKPPDKSDICSSILFNDFSRLGQTPFLLLSFLPSWLAVNCSSVFIRLEFVLLLPCFVIFIVHPISCQKLEQQTCSAGLNRCFCPQVPC